MVFFFKKVEGTLNCMQRTWVFCLIDVQEFHPRNRCVVFPIRFKLYRDDALFGLELVLSRVSRVADPHLFNADPVPTCHFNADSYPDSSSKWCDLRPLVYIPSRVWGLPPRNQWGPLTRWPSANTASQRGGTPLLSPLPPSNLYCNLYISDVP